MMILFSLAKSVYLILADKVYLCEQNSKRGTAKCH